MKTNLTWLNLAIFRPVHPSILLCQAITSPAPYLSPWYCVKQYHALPSLLTIVSSNVTPQSLQQYHDPYHISHPSLPPYLWGEQCDSQYLPLYSISSNNTPLPPSLLSRVSCYVKFFPSLLTFKSCIVKLFPSLNTTLCSKFMTYPSHLNVVSSNITPFPSLLTFVGSTLRLKICRSPFSSSSL